MIKYVLFLFLIPFAYAYYGGENITVDYSINCSAMVAVDVEKNNFKNNEYRLLGCNETDNNYWECGCTDNLVLSTQLYSEGEYKLTIISDLPPTEAQTISGSNNVGSAAYYYYIRKKQLENNTVNDSALFVEDVDFFEKEVIIIEKPDNKDILNITKKEQKFILNVIPKDNNDLGILLIIGFVVIIAGIAIWIFYFKT